jgi:DhnA family fructose-bisphosphate aldolase class Ia
VSGKSIRLGKLFSKGRAVVVALDHGGYMGPIPGVVDLPKEIKRYRGADGIVLNPQMVRFCSDFFSRREAPMCIVRVNWGSHYAQGFTKGYGERMSSVRRAVALGADIVICSFLLGGSEEANVKNVTLLGEVYEETEELGVPLVGEFIPLTGIDRYEGGVDLIKTGNRIASEVGADLLKTVYAPGFRQVVESVPIPVLGLGGAKTGRAIDALEIAASCIKDGAKGVVFGRNVFQADQPEKFLDALISVVKEGVSPAQAAKGL